MKVLNILRKERYEIINLDVVVQAEQPKIMPYKMAMRRHIAQTLSIDVSCVSMKATTNEGIGAIGKGEGIAAFAVALINKK